MNVAFLLIGGNIGDREKNLETAKSLIQLYCGKVTKSSSLYQTAPWGKTNQPAFLNQALQIETRLTAEELMHQILAIEKMMGRERTEKYGPRIIDIDILLFDNTQYDSSFLKIPHPEMHNRLFALIPLAEIAPTMHHPVLKKSISQLLTETPDKLEVKKYTASRD
jgi:2-amino-4-hydroxy-6-hydroxymethyldihydropteridine diphosphokinase